MTQRNCISCKNSLTQLHPTITTTPDKAMWLNGLVDIIAANYGSIYDGNKYIIAICDTCIEHHVREKNIEYIGSYMQ